MPNDQLEGSQGTTGLTPPGPGQIPSRPHDLDGLSDEGLARLARVDDRRWLGELFRRYEARIKGCAHRMVSPEEVEDAVGEIALRLVRSLPKFRGESSVGTWLYAVAHHTCIDIRRRRKPATDLEPVLRYLEDPDRPEVAFDTSILACRTATAMANLPEGQRDVVAMRLGMGVSTTDTARRLGITTDAVKARLRRARASLRSQLSEMVVCPRCGPGRYDVEELRRS